MMSEAQKSWVKKEWEFLGTSMFATKGMVSGNEMQHALSIITEMEQENARLRDGLDKLVRLSGLGPWSSQQALDIYNAAVGKAASEAE